MRIIEDTNTDLIAPIRWADWRGSMARLIARHRGTAAGEALTNRLNESQPDPRGLADWADANCLYIVSRLDAMAAGSRELDGPWRLSAAGEPYRLIASGPESDPEGWQATLRRVGRPATLFVDYGGAIPSRRIMAEA